MLVVVVVECCVLWHALLSPACCSLVVRCVLFWCVLFVVWCLVFARCCFCCLRVVRCLSFVDCLLLGCC